MNDVWIGTNWKMTKTIKEGIAYTKELTKMANIIKPEIKLFIIPSHTALVSIKEIVTDTRIALGAQNMHWEEMGAYTGEISPSMLEEIGIDIIELGHSERRKYFNETDESINKKVLAALRFGIKPLICIGENLEQKSSGISKEILAMQLKVCLRGVPKEHAIDIIIAYEPVWAIGEEGSPAHPGYVAEIHTFLRNLLEDFFEENGASIPLLYGGSVNKENCLEYLAIDDVNGLFIGRSAWETSSFEEILLMVQEVL